MIARGPWGTGAPIPPPPTPLEKAQSLACCISGFGNSLAALFGGPLYLVGSAVTSHDPGDIDLRLCLSREICVLYWGEDFDGPSYQAPPGWVARKREELKQSRRLTKTFGKHYRRFDFQFQCSLFGESGEPVGHEGKPRVRVDSLPRSMFDAGMGTP